MEGETIPSLFTYLKDKYVEYLATELQEHPRTDEAFKPEELALRSTTADFLAFTEKFFLEVRPVQTFPLDDNIGVVLSNFDRVGLAPMTSLSGTMQPSTAVPVFPQQPQPGMGTDNKNPGTRII